ncbi:unnamed protein product [Cylicocyclus nassatus]|uniref:Uncharacterized protein n=1 Tax=Cylicocyclus nassatus TaxID=53992 RepID=A0AA36GFS7_CYLNA|nr:unnamed protein product [Cylicocyclus nassatus]
MARICLSLIVFLLPVLPSVAIENGSADQVVQSQITSREEEANAPDLTAVKTGPTALDEAKAPGAREEGASDKKGARASEEELKAPLSKIDVPGIKWTETKVPAEKTGTLAEKASAPDAGPKESAEGEDDGEEYDMSSDGDEEDEEETDRDDDGGFSTSWSLTKSIQAALERKLEHRAVLSDEVPYMLMASKLINNGYRDGNYHFWTESPTKRGEITVHIMACFAPAGTSAELFASLCVGCLDENIYNIQSAYWQLSMGCYQVEEKGTLGCSFGKYKGPDLVDYEIIKKINITQPIQPKSKE